MSGVVNAGCSGQLNFIISRITRTTLFNEEEPAKWTIKDEAPNTHPKRPNQVRLTHLEPNHTGTQKWTQGDSMSHMKFVAKKCDVCSRIDVYKKPQKTTGMLKVVGSYPEVHIKPASKPSNF